MHIAIHIGLEKTGTSIIQDFLAENRTLLGDQGVVYTKSAGDRGSQIGFVAAVLENPTASDVARLCGLSDQAQLPAFREWLAASLDREFTQAGEGGRAIVSSEHFHSRLTSVEEIERLRRYLGRWASSFSVIMYLRRQDKVAVSRYSTKLRGGERDGVFGLDFGGEYYYDYKQIYLNWAEVFGADNVVVRIYEKDRFAGGGLLADFCACAGLALESLKLDARQSNVALNQQGADIMEVVGGLVPSWIGGKRNPVFWHISDYVYENFQGGFNPIVRSEAVAFYGRFREANRDLARLLSKGSREDLFDDDFALYPVHLEPNRRSFRDGLAFAVQFSESLINRSAADMNRIRQEFGEIEARAREAGQRAQEAEGRVREAEQRAQEAEGRVQEAEGRAQRAEARAQELEASLAITEAAAERLRLQADGWHERVRALHNSTSWQITAPVRAIKRLVRGDLSPARRVGREALHCVKRAIRPAALVAARELVKRPALRYRVGAKLREYPIVRQHLVLFVRNAGLIPGDPGLLSSPEGGRHLARSDLAQLGPRARQVYCDLRAAIEQHRAGGCNADRH